MKKLILLILILVGVSGIMVAQEMKLDPNQSINEQITADTLSEGSQAHSVYKAESGEIYTFDGTLLVDFDLVIEGPDNGWIMKDAAPPCFIKTPDITGIPVNMIIIDEGGSITLKNILLSGLYSNADNISCFVRNFAGSKIIFDNCVFTDYKDFAARTTRITEEISITNCLFINGDRRAYSPFGGIPIRLDAGAINILLENNTVVNSGRLLGNGGNYFTSNLHELHCTYLNAQVNTHELHWFEGIQANNIFYNWSWIGWKGFTFQKYFTTFETFASIAEKLDSIALYNGRNLFYRESAITDYYQNELSGSVMPFLLWNIEVDSTILADENFTIGKSYGGFDPGFTRHPGNTEEMLEWLYAYWTPDQRPVEAPDWRIPSPVTYDNDGQPALNWPSAFDLSYLNKFLQKAGTDGLPLGDLNWFPDAKAKYLVNRDVYIAALQDSIANATDVYIPGDSASALITPDLVSVENIINGLGEFSLYQNYPNPFNPSTTISFSLPSKVFVLLKVFDVLGREISILVSEELTEGHYSCQWNAVNVPSGIYFYRLDAGTLTKTRKLVLLH